MAMGFRPLASYPMAAPPVGQGFIVRLFGYLGVRQESILARDSVYDLLLALNDHYEFHTFAVTNGLIPVTLGPSRQAPIDLAQFVRVEVPDGQAIRYEIQTPNRSQPADANSPLLTGVQQVAWGPRWSLSVIDATGT